MAKKPARGKGRQKRAYLKRFSAEYISTGQSTDFKSRSIFDVNSRAKGIGKPIVETLQPNSPRMQVFERMVEQQKLIQGPFLQRMRTFHHIVVWSGKVTEQRIFFSGQEVYVVLINDLQKKAKRSVNYKTVEKARRAINMSLVEWKEEEFFDTV